MKKLERWMPIFLEKNILIKTCITILISFFQISQVNAMDGNTAIAQFTNDFVKQISQEYGFRPFGAGASFPVKLKSIGIDFKANYCQNVNGARKLAVEIAHKMIEKMKQDINLQKYLSDIPATVKNIDLTIIFKESNDGKRTEFLHSVMVIGSREKVFFNIDNSSPRLVTLHEETFDEAERIVQQEAASKLNTPESLHESN